MNFTISEIAERMGISPSAIRYYDKEGLLPDIKRVNGIRIFDEQDFGWLRILSCLKNTGMPIRRIKEYVELCKKGDASLNARYELIKAQRQFVQDQIDQLDYYMQELDYKDWFYNKALAKGSAEGINVEDYVKETGKKNPMCVKPKQKG